MKPILLKYEDRFFQLKMMNFFGVKIQGVSEQQKIHCIMIFSQMFFQLLFTLKIGLKGIRLPKILCYRRSVL